jgi:PAS domain S-box-containing protein
MKKKIMVVDNHPVILRYLSDLLSREGHEVMTAVDGLCALDLLQTFTPGIIFIDLVMPNIDGKKLCQIIRRMRGFEKVHLIILSGVAAEEELDFASLGADACIAKGPFPMMAKNVLMALEGLDRAKPGVPSQTIMGIDHASSRTAMKELLHIKRHFEVILERMSEGLLEVSRGARIIYANPMAKTLIEMPEEKLLGMRFVDLFDGFDRQRVERLMMLLSSGCENISEDSPVNLNGRQVALKVLTIHDEYSQAIVILSDISERKQMEAQLEQAQKLEAIGVLAGGIAHDFNNILTAILGNITLAKMYSEPGNKSYERLEDAERASLRAKDLTQQLLTFARGGAPVKKTARISEIIQDACNFALRGSNVRCEMYIADDLWPAEIDVGQISQVIHNLVINADQAMPDGGIVRVRAENLIVDNAAEIHLQPGRYVRITVQDYGIGIQKEHLNRIFDPYFTTKQMGSGLGLATVYSIIKNHKAHISVESEIGRGTVFYIHLLASRKEMMPKNYEEQKTIAGKGRILVMDDEEMVRRIVGQMLSLLGYDADYANDGAEAIEMYRRNRESGTPFDAVIMDLTIPGGMGGREAIRELLRLDPEIKAVVSSGYSNDPVMSDCKAHGFKAVIVKPYQVRELGEVLKGMGSM